MPGILERERESLKSLVQALQVDITGLQKELSLNREEKSVALAKLEAEQTAHQTALSAKEREAEQHEKTKQRLIESNQSLAEIRVQLDNEKASALEKIELLNQARESLSLQFKTLAQDILEEKSKKFSDTLFERNQQ